MGTGSGAMLPLHLWWCLEQHYNHLHHAAPPLQLKHVSHAHFLSCDIAPPCNRKVYLWWKPCSAGILILKGLINQESHIECDDTRLAGPPHYCTVLRKIYVDTIIVVELVMHFRSVLCGKFYPTGLNRSKDRSSPATCL